MPPRKLIGVLQSPETVSAVSAFEWNEILLQARKNQLTGQLAARLRRSHQMASVPLEVQRHLDLEALMSKRRGEAALWEVASMRRAVDSRFKLVLLKGCAYLAAGDHNSEGRVFSDVDVLVKREELPAVESDLVAVGWKPSSVNAYDTAYYRDWMHEVPPMSHVRRHTVVDLHHAINPPVSRYYVDPARLFENLVSIDHGVFVLAPSDRTIHCSLHLLQEGESKKLLRDLFDLYTLLEQHHQGSSGTAQLMTRASALGVAQPVGTAIEAARAVFDPERAGTTMSSGWLDRLVVRAALTANGQPGISGEFAASVVLTHSHWMKMPMRILVPHLLRKSALRMNANKEAGT
jgi:Uncharacterised nucleotidyltransferase